MNFNWDLDNPPYELNYDDTYEYGFGTSIFRLDSATNTFTNFRMTNMIFDALQANGYNSETFRYLALILYLLESKDIKTIQIDNIIVRNSFFQSSEGYFSLYSNNIIFQDLLFENNGY